MSDDRIQHGLDAYADQLKRTAQLAPAAEIRRRAGRRRRNQAVGAAFAAVLIAAVGLGTLLRPAPEHPSIPSTPSVGPSPSLAPTHTSTSTVKSNVSQLRQLGIDLEVGVLIDVADDGVDHWMQIGSADTVDFIGAVKDDSTEMSLRPAPVTNRNRVVIAPPARPGFCVTATPQPPLALQPCRDGDETQTWQVVPAGDSGQFNLAGPYGVVTVAGRDGLQTIRFDK